jgi:hypothetical protein
MKNGRYCKSGMAVIDPAANSMKCVTIDVVKTNIDDYASKVANPQKCKISENGEVVSDFDSACKYYYKDDSGDQLIGSEYCECSLMEEIVPGEEN